MEQGNEGFAFSALGTRWSIVVDGEILRDDAKQAILEYIQSFDRQFSRFIDTSEANAFRDADAGEYIISEEFATLLSKADELRRLTDGVYDPAVGGLLERAGYDATYSMKPLPNTAEFILPKWKISRQTLTLDGSAVFDIGGMGKGYCIDTVAGILKKFGHTFFLVDGGGDMFGTTKANSSPWRIAIEYPGRADSAAGVVELENQGLAVSDSFRRRWGKWHHLVDPRSNRPIDRVIGAAAVAPSAWDADCTTSALYFAPTSRYPAISEIYRSSYLVFQDDGTTLVSSNWQGEIF